VSDDDVFDAFDGETLDLIVPGTLDEMRLDRVLALLTGLSRSETNDIIASGAVKWTTRSIAKSSTPFREGQHLVAQ
jgi:RNA-binding protein YlmH